MRGLKLSAPPPAQYRKSIPALARLILVALSGGLACVTLWLFLTAQPRARAAPPALPHNDTHQTLEALSQVDDNWTKRIKLTFTNTAQAEDLVNFPVLVVLNSNRIDYGHTQDLGQDIRFVDADDTTVLAHEIERWDESGVSYVWVRVPQIDGASNADFVWMYYGNPDATDGQDPANVWSESYRMVYHLEENPGTNGVIHDSTVNSFTATNRGSTDVEGFIANAQAFDGSNQYVDLGRDLAVINQVSAATLSTWIRPNSVSDNGDILGVSRYNGVWPTANSRAGMIKRDANLHVYARSLDDDSDFTNVTTTSDPLSANTWHYVVIVVDYAGDAITIYVDGAPQPTTGAVDFYSATTPNTNSTNGAIGCNDNGTGPFFDGRIDEARVVATARSPDWIAAQHLSMTDAFIAYGDEEEVGLPVLSLTKWASQNEVYAGSRLDYWLLVGNTGGTARHLVVSDTLPSHTTFGGCGCSVTGLASVSGVSSMGAGDCGAPFTCGLEGNEVVWRVDEMASDRLLQMSFWVTVDAGLSDGAMIVNDHYAVVADRFSPLAGNEPVTTTVREMLVSVSNVAWPDPVTFGEQLEFTITVRNDGELLHGVMITNLLPSGVSFVGCGGALCELGGGGEQVRWWLSTLPAASEHNLTVRVSVDGVASDTLVNERYAVWIPAADQSVTGPPITVTVLDSLPGPYRLYLPCVFSNATQ